MSSDEARSFLNLVPSIGDAAVEAWAEELERGRWPGWVCDRELVLRFVSTELKRFMSDSVGRPLEDEELGVGVPFLEAMVNEAWRATIEPESLTRMLPRSMAYLRSELGPEAEATSVPEPFRSILDGAPVVDTFGGYSERFLYTVPGLPPYPVEFLIFTPRDRAGNLTAVVCVSQMGIRPTLVSLLARGDEAMYERMARLQEPRRCQGAILFADLQGSSRLSRALPTSIYFALIRSLATGVDRAIASNGGVVGRHAGDGVSGFFLVPEGDGGWSTAASAAGAAADIQASARDVIAKYTAETNVDPSEHPMNVGLHWGASIYMGQLVPGGRLEVTALGDSVNECARIQETARNGSLLASKQFIEQLSEEDATWSGIDLQRLVYTSVAEIAGASERAIRDAGSIPVAPLNPTPAGQTKG